jgi:hypothetical protein
MHGALYVEGSDNRKISGDDKVDATYASIKATCPDTCSLKNAGCYAQESYVGMTVRKLNKKARQHSPLKLARAEAQTINASYRGGPVPQDRALRIHVSGDSRTKKGTRLISKAVSKWKARGGGDVWSYTHAHSHVPRKEWGSVSILASVDSIEQVEGARKQGYAPAIVVDHHPSEKAYKLTGSDTTFIPCPQQTRNVPCVDCRLCMKADWLYETNRGIAFAAHGVKRNEVKRHLKVVM